MRQALELAHVNVPGYEHGFSDAEVAHVTATVAEWHASSFAGYRRGLDSGSDCDPNLAAIVKVAKSRSFLGGRKVKHFVQLGTGGASLGGEAVLCALPPKDPELNFYFADNNDPTYFHHLLAGLNPEETLFFVVSKSGKSPETISQFLVAMEWLQARVKNWRDHFVICTDPKKSELLEAAGTLGLETLPFPTAVGGRFSVLTAQGLFPAAFAGHDPAKMVEGARNFAVSLEQKNLTDNSVALLARSLIALKDEYPLTILFPYSSRLRAFSRWFCQLWAESLGKKGYGLTPYPAIGTTDQHSQMQLYMEGPKDKVIVFIAEKNPEKTLPLSSPENLRGLSSFKELHGISMWDLFQAEFFATRDAVTNQKIPNATILVDKLDEYSLGALFYFWELATTYAGAALGVNPYDQPGVEAAKILTKEYLAKLKR